MTEVKLLIRIGKIDTRVFLEAEQIMIDLIRVWKGQLIANKHSSKS